MRVRERLDGHQIATSDRLARERARNGRPLPRLYLPDNL